MLPRELRHVIANIGEKVDEDELEEMMKDADKDGNGKIDYKEFVATLLNAGRRAAADRHFTRASTLHGPGAAKGSQEARRRRCGGGRGVLR